MQEADVAHEGQVSELKSTVQHGVDQLKEKEVEIKKLMKSAEEKDQKIQASGSKASARLVCLPWFRC